MWTIESISLNWCSSPPYIHLQGAKECLSHLNFQIFKRVYTRLDISGNVNMI